MKDELHGYFRVKLKKRNSQNKNNLFLIHSLYIVKKIMQYITQRRKSCLGQYRND